MIDIKIMAQYGMLIIFMLVLLFHVLVITKVIPYTIVWGSRLKTDKDMFKFEAISIIVNIVFLFFLLFISDFLTSPFSGTILNGGLWVMAILFFVNIIANIFSKNKLEKIIFVPVSALLFIFAVILL